MNIPAVLRGRLAAAIAAGSATLIASTLVGWFEGTVYTPYYDPGGVLTVCRGHTGPDIVPGKTYTEEECAELERRDIAIAEAGVDRQVRVPLSPAMRGALIDFVFNVGESQFARSTLLRKLNAGDYAGACLEYERWRYQNGKVLRGLILRREAEMWTCMQGIPEKVAPIPLERPEREA